MIFCYYMVLVELLFLSILDLTDHFIKFKNFEIIIIYDFHIKEKFALDYLKSCLELPHFCNYKQILNNTMQQYIKSYANLTTLHSIIEKINLDLQIELITLVRSQEMQNKAESLAIINFLIKILVTNMGVIFVLNNLFKNILAFFYEDIVYEFISEKLQKDYGVFVEMTPAQFKIFFKPIFWMIVSKYSFLQILFT